MLSLKDDAVEIKSIKANEKNEYYKLLIDRVEFVLDGYRSQLDGLRFKERRLKKDRRDSILLVAGAALFEGLLLILMFPIPVLFLFAIPATVAFYGVFPFLLGSMVKRIFKYSVMMETKQGLKYITNNRVRTFKDEERFIARKIVEYEAVLAEVYINPDPSEENIIELEKLTRPEEFHAEPIEKEFKLWPFWAVTAFWTAFDLVLVYLVRHLIRF